LFLVATQARAEETTSAAPQRTAVDPALKRGDLRIANLAPAAPAASASAGATLRVGGAGAPIDGRTGQLHAIGGVTAAQASTSAGNVRTIDAPRSAEPAVRAAGKPHRRHGATSKVQDAQRVAIEALNPRFAGCLTDADAAVDGTAVFNAVIAPTGEVTSTAILTPGGVSPKATACLRDVVAHAKFAASGEAQVVQVRVVPSELRAQSAARDTVAEN
jgi:hypothetical protein